MTANSPVKGKTTSPLVVAHMADRSQYLQRLPNTYLYRRPLLNIACELPGCVG
jgi:hypothetical protein